MEGVGTGKCAEGIKPHTDTKERKNNAISYIRLSAF